MAEPDLLDVVEICAGAGGQALGLERAGFEHALAVELDGAACATLRANRPAWKVAEGDVADRDLWRPEDYRGVALLAGGVPCPPFTDITYSAAASSRSMSTSTISIPSRASCLFRLRQ